MSLARYLGWRDTWPSTLDEDALTRLAVDRPPLVAVRQAERDGVPRRTGRSLRTRWTSPRTSAREDAAPEQPGSKGRKTEERE